MNIYEEPPLQPQKGINYHHLKFLGLDLSLDFYEFVYRKNEETIWYPILENSIHINFDKLESGKCYIIEDDNVQFTYKVIYNTTDQIAYK